MYTFEANYENMGNKEKIKRPIYITVCTVENEKQAYMYAMERAYNMKRDNECLASVEFIGC